MKQISLIATLLIALASCNFNSNNANLAEEPKGKQFFKFDAIDYYFNNYDEEKLGELFDNESKSALDSIKKGIIIGEIPSGIDNLSFLSYLTKTGYDKSVIGKNKMKAISTFFVEKKSKEHVASLCIHVYRDILIFKSEDIIVGTAKICFECNANQITGAKANTEDFGQDGDYEKLETLLRQ